MMLTLQVNLKKHHLKTRRKWHTRVTALISGTQRFHTAELVEKGRETARNERSLDQPVTLDGETLGHHNTITSLHRDVPGL